MRLAPESHRRIENFLREHLHDEKLELPAIFIYSGGPARWITNKLHILAITFGRRIFIAPKLVKRDEQNQLTAPAALIAHEATHVVQYSQAGVLGFFASYLGEYFRVLRAQNQGWGKAARNAAYLGIRHEREAYEAETAYASWRGLEKIIEETGQASLPLSEQKLDQEPETS